MYVTQTYRRLLEGLQGKDIKQVAAKSSRNIAVLTGAKYSVFKHQQCD